MADIEKFRDEALKKALYEARNPDSLPTDILMPGNSNTNAKMCHLLLCMDNSADSLEGAFSCIKDDLSKDIIQLNRTVDGYSIIKAIEAEGCKASVAVEEKKKLGII